MATEFAPAAVVLEGVHVRLEPLTVDHAADLLDVGRDESIWRYMPNRGFQNVDDTRAWIERALERAVGGTELPFATVHKADGVAIGSTRYLDIRHESRGLEIGFTWLGTAYWRTPVNTECKFLLLRHAFETLGAIRVQLKTDLRNERSQRAIERIGGVREGVLRKQMIMPDGHHRDSVYYGILDTEWPAVRERLQDAMARS